MPTKVDKAQASIDLLVAYGVAILIISIAIYVVLQLGVFNSRLAPSYCNAAPGFTCTAVAIKPSGTLTVVFSQSTGATLTITGMACSNQQNLTSVGPRYGNVNILTNYAVPFGNPLMYYPSNQLYNGLKVYSSNQTRASVNCFGGSGLAKGGLGNQFTGFVWIRYTVSTLPNNYNTIQQLVAVSTKYT